ncbi:hypothetical protein [uncultured Tenacibaculum sp.]|uniref:hypothetical protein n=1 Tax=uncultured Tenacibaculum sp. TaxID=174713 RepID=UPI00262FAB05|nr:hypothetical protein [uncultured Tenacibaculum sp.]
MINYSNIIKFIVTSLLILFSFSTYSQEINVVDNKGTVNTVNNNNVYTSATDPNTPTPIALENDIWFDTSTTPNTIKVWDGTTWLSLANNFWSLTGNAGTNPTTNYLGTSDGQDLVLRTNNVEAMRINQSNQYVGIGISGATSPLHISKDLADGIGIIRVQGTEPDINFNDTDGGFNTFTFENAGVAKFAFGRRNTDAFYITRNDGTWHDETFNILNTNGHIGLNTDAPSERLDVNGKLRVRDIATTTADNDILTTTATGVIEKKSSSKFENTWLGKDDNLTADKDDSEIYKNGKVGIGDFSASTIDAQLHTKSTDVPFKIEPNTTTPTGTSGGQMYVDSTDGILYIYDNTRTKWLSVHRTMVGWGRNSNNTTNEYLRQFNGAQSNNNGWRMIRNGTITAISAQTNINQTWTIEIRKNDVTTVITSLTMTSVQGNHNNTINVNVNEGDFIQAYCNGNSIDFPQVLIEIAWRK